MAERTIAVAPLQEYCIAVLSKAGLMEQDAITVAEALLYADLRGVDSHGVVRLPSYLRRVQAGVMKTNANMQFEYDYPALALLDAGNGFGQVAGVKAMAHAVEKARVNGISAVGVRNSNHFGVAGFFATKALSSNMVGVVMTNASPAIAPFGSKTPLLGTNPLAVAIPAAREKPIVLDMATSVVARGRVRLALLEGKKIPPDWALDSRGEPTTDPAGALEGTLAAIGGPKGSGLSLVIDILCGILTNSSATGAVRNLTDNSGPGNTGHMFWAIDVEKFGGVESFTQRVDEVICLIKGLPAKRGTRVYLPGEIELDLETKRVNEGIPLHEEVVAGLTELAQMYGATKYWQRCVG